MLFCATLLLFISSEAHSQIYNGRFQIIDTEHTTYLLGTQTGQVWQHAISKKDGYETEYWDPMIRFDSQKEKNQAITEFLSSVMARKLQEKKEPIDEEVQLKNTQ